MSYMLLLSFTYHRYRKDATIRIYADDHLVDELTLTEDIGWKVVDVTHPPVYRATWIGPHNRCSIIFLPKKNFLFEISEKYLHKKIRIEVENDHNNYTNGYMTKFSYVSINDIILFPKFLSYYKNWLKLKRFFWKGSENKSMWDEPEKTLISHNNMENYYKDIKKGGSFQIDIPLFRKHSIISFGKIRSGKIYIYVWRLVFLWAYKVLNIENEDQRSNRT